MHRRRSAAARAAVLALLAMLSSSCAFANPANRPVWNAFEDNLVPESDGAFWATLPLTAPVGVLAILVDTFVAHPLQVVDDAWDDTVSMWTDLPFDEEYYTTSASLPFRAVGTPLMFAGSFLARSVFDIHEPLDQEERRQKRQATRRKAVLEWLERIENGENPNVQRRFPEVIDEDVVAAVQRALAQGGAHARIRVYRAVTRSEDPTIVDWLAALRDPSGVVRYEVLDLMPKSIEVPAPRIEELLADPDQAVRERAAERWRP